MYKGKVYENIVHFAQILRAILQNFRKIILFSILPSVRLKIIRYLSIRLTELFLLIQ